MIGKYKDFYKFVKCFNSSICSIWEEFNNRKDPQPGDKFMINFYNTEMLDQSKYGEVIFDKVDFDPTFKNGVAFIYRFHDENTGEEYIIRSINDVDDPKLLRYEELKDLYGFWKYSSPVYAASDADNRLRTLE